MAAKHSHHKVVACLKRNMFQQSQNMPVQVQEPKSVNTKKQKIKRSSNWRPYFFSTGTTVHIKYNFIQHTVLTKLPDLGGDRGSTAVKVLRYKSEGHWFDPR
jgi:hypothetical protein